MPRFKVFRRKFYEAFIEAPSPELALAYARDIPGREWRMTDDVVDGRVAGLDNARRRAGDDKQMGEA